MSPYQEPGEPFWYNDGRLLLTSVTTNQVGRNPHISWEIVQAALGQVREWYFREWRDGRNCVKVRWVVEDHDPGTSAWDDFKKVIRGKIERYSPRDSV